RFSRDWSSDVCSSDLNMQSFHVSKINYSYNQLIEYIPDLSLPEINRQVYYIMDSLCYPVDPMERHIIFSDLTGNQEPFLVWKKKIGRASCRERVKILV